MPLEEFHCPPLRIFRGCPVGPVALFGLARVIVGVMRAVVIYEFHGHVPLLQLLHQRRAHAWRHLVVVTTHGSSKFINSLQGEPGKRVAFRSIRLMCRHTVRTHWLALYRMDRCGDPERTAFLDRVEKRLSRIKDVRAR